LSATDLLVELEIQPGMTVANLRAGDGWFALPMARLVGPTGKVVAEDPSASLLEFVQFSAAQNGYSNLTTVRGAALDSRLPAGAFDVVLACETMSAFYTNAQAQDPAWVDAHVLPFLRSVVAALKPEGRAIFMEPLPSAERPGILDPKYVVRDLERIGLVEFDELDAYRPGPAVMVFERAAAAAQEAPAPKASPTPALPVAAPVAR
jgi:SAM-dependent methyltransferase